MHKRRHEIQVERSRTHQDSGARRGIFQNQPPLFLQRRAKVCGKPVLVIQQHKMSVCTGVIAQKIAQRSRMGMNALRARANRGEMLRQEVVGATIRRVPAKEIQVPEVVVPKREFEKNLSQTMPEIAGHAVFEVIGGQGLLAFRHAQHALQEMLLQGPLQKRVEESRFEFFVPDGLLGQVLGGKQVFGQAKHFRLHLQPLADHPGHRAAGAIPVKRTPHTPT